MLIQWKTFTEILAKPASSLTSENHSAGPGKDCVHGAGIWRVWKTSSLGGKVYWRPTS